jgi:hypothetical protein
LLKFLNKFVLNAKFNVEDICQIYKRLKIDAGDDSDTLTYINFMTSILPPPAVSGVCLNANESPDVSQERKNKRYSPPRITKSSASPLKGS